MSKYIPDIVCLVGLILLGVGVAFYSVPFALVSIGGLLVLLSLHVAKNSVVNNVSE